MTSKNNVFLKNLSKALLITHLLIILLIIFFTGNFANFLGAIVFIAGNQILVIISFFLLLYKKISKTGTYVFITFQVLASIGMYLSQFINTSPFLGIILGIFSNSLYIICMILLLHHNLESLSANTGINISSIPPSNQTMKFCRKCGNQPPVDSEFCPYCGQKIQSDNAIQNCSPISQESNNKNHIDFTNASSHSQSTGLKQLKHIKLTKDEKCVLIGENSKRMFSLTLWIIYILYCFFAALAVSSTYEIRTFGWSRTQEYLLGIEFETEGVHLLDGMNLVIYAICILILIIPIPIFSFVRRNLSKNEIVLTNTQIHFYSSLSEEICNISLNSIKSIDVKPCPWFWGASKIKITQYSGDTYGISGLSNAEEFVKACISAAKRTTS